MSTHGFYSPKTTKKIGDAFIERWKADPDTPISKRVIQDIIYTIDPKRTITSLKGTCPNIQPAIEARMKKECKALPPVLGARGVLIKRNLDGSLGEKISRHANGNTPAEKPEANGTPKTVTRLADLTLPAAVNHRTLPRTKWNMEEQEALLHQWVKIWAENPGDGLTLESFNKAMHIALPEARWRHIYTLSALPEGFYLNVMLRLEEIARRGMTPPEVKTITVERAVTVPYNPEKVLSEVSIPMLASVLARRQAEETQTFYAMLSGKFGAAKPATENLADKGVDLASIDALLPRVQVFGFKPTQHAAMLAQFRDKPVKFAPSVSPDSPLEPSRIMANCDMYILDSTADNMKPWWEMICANIPYEKREKVHGASRALDHVRQVAGNWMSRHADLTAKWRTLHAAAPTPANGNGHA